MNQYEHATLHALLLKTSGGKQRALLAREPILVFTGCHFFSKSLHTLKRITPFPQAPSWRVVGQLLFLHDILLWTFLQHSNYQIISRIICSGHMSVSSGLICVCQEHSNKIRIATVYNTPFVEGNNCYSLSTGWIESKAVSNYKVAGCSIWYTDWNHFSCWKQK